MSEKNVSFYKPNTGYESLNEIMLETINRQETNITIIEKHFYSIFVGLKFLIVDKIDAAIVKFSNFNDNLIKQIVSTTHTHFLLYKFESIHNRFHSIVLSRKLCLPHQLMMTSIGE